MTFFKKDKMYFKIYITTIISVVMSIFITSSLLYINFESIIMKHEYETKEEQMESQATQIAKLSERATNTVFQIYNDVTLSKLFYYRDVDTSELSVAILQLRYTMMANTNLDSIYIYNKNNDAIYTVTKSNIIKEKIVDYYSLSDKFPDESAAEIFRNLNHYVPYKPIPRQFAADEKTTKNYYSYIMYNVFAKDGQTSAIMLNYKENYLFQDTESNHSDKVHNSWLVIDENEKVVTDSEAFPLGSQLSDNFNSESKFKKNESGYYLTKIEGIKSVVVYTHPDKHGWRYISITQIDDLLGQVGKLQKITIGISLLIACVGVLAAFIFSSKLSIPIKKMANDIKNLEHQKKNSEIIVQNTKIKELLQDGTFYNSDNKRAVNELLSFMNVQIDAEKKLVLVLLILDDYQTVIEERDMQTISAYKFAATNILDELMSNKSKLFSIDIGSEKSLILINTDDEELEQLLETKLLEMQQLMEEYFSISSSVFVSHFDKKVEQIFELYEQVEEAASRRIFMGKNCIVFSSRITLNTADNYEYPVNKEKQLVENLMLGKVEEAYELYILITKETYQYPIVIYNTVISRLVFAINNVISLIKKNNQMQTGSSAVIIGKLIQNSDSLEVKNQKFYELFIQMKVDMTKTKSEKQDMIINNINNMISIDFEDPSFSLEKLADKVGMSMAYMCRIYKQYTGTTINDTLTNMRMEKARKLILESSLSVGEIAEKVGFSSTSYFYRAFKKNNGVTPNEYRKKD